MKDLKDMNSTELNFKLRDLRKEGLKSSPSDLKKMIQEIFKASEKSIPTAQSEIKELFQKYQNDPKNRGPKEFISDNLQEEIIASIPPGPLMDPFMIRLYANKLIETFEPYKKDYVVFSKECTIDFIASHRKENQAECDASKAVIQCIEEHMHSFSKKRLRKLQPLLEGEKLFLKIMEAHLAISELENRHQIFCDWLHYNQPVGELIRLAEEKGFIKSEAPHHESDSEEAKVSESEEKSETKSSKKVHERNRLITFLHHLRHSPSSSDTEELCENEEVESKTSKKSRKGPKG